MNKRKYRINDCCLIEEFVLEKYLDQKSSKVKCRSSTRKTGSDSKADVVKSPSAANQHKNLLLNCIQKEWKKLKDHCHPKQS
jgi:hypothetical protein